MLDNARVRVRIEVRGIVQGVGFRPFVHRLVERCGFSGWVRNTSSGAELELEGERAALFDFAGELERSHPVLALIESVTVREQPGLRGYDGFEIVKSERGAAVRTLVSPDVGICDDCRRELFDPADRRYRYPFINCTNCGPRFTIIKSVPYDRAATSMAAFPMCPECAAEFGDIRNRRYHAQPDCCPVCGPQVFFLDAHGAPVAGDAVALARDCLKAGRIVAIKGLGGLHLACTAEDPDAARTLRARKHRDEKPFAVMCRDADCAARLCEISRDERRALESFRKPIVLLRKRDPRGLAHLSENAYLGVMLPYTPLHCLLFGDDIDCLVMTSANLSDRPILYRNEEALKSLAGIADGFLLHDREIQTRCDDSLIRIYAGRDYPIRRSRGYVPYPVITPEVTGAILACGAEQKASFCISKPGYVFPSQHIGDLKNLETLENYEAQIAHFENLFGVKPAVLACDLHPDYLSTEYAEARAAREGLPLVRVQHHHAHLAACMADNGLDGECLGLIWDGTGFGTDGTVWGGELLRGGYGGFARLGSIRPIPLPGGDAAVREIWRTGLALLWEAGIPAGGLLEAGGREAVLQMLEKGLSCPQSSGMGRLFDGVCAVAGIREVCTYEGQGAVLLEAAAVPDEGGYTPIFYDRAGVGVFDWRPMVRAMAEELADGVPGGVLAARFMNTLVNAAALQCEDARARTGLNRVVLSGGVFQNAYLLARLPECLRARGFEVFTHSRVSANDEGLSLGQIFIAEYSHVSCGSTQNH